MQVIAAVRSQLKTVWLVAAGAVVSQQLALHKVTLVYVANATRNQPPTHDAHRKNLPIRM